MTFLLYFLQFDWEKLRPEKLFGGQVLERTPAGLSIVYLVGLAVLIGFLLLSFFGNFRRPKFNFEENLPKEVKRKLTTTLANRSLRVWQFVFIALALSVYGFHVYWTYYAGDVNEQFQKLSYKDLRNRRTNTSTLRGWMLDRSGNLGSALAYYKVDKDGKIDRTFPLEKEMAHLLGTERGTPGLERTLYTKEADPMPEAWEILTKYKKPEPENKDVRITIDRDLQTFLAQQLEVELKKNRKGAIVVLNPQTGDVLGLYSTPTYSLSEANTLEGYLKLEGDKMNKPLLNRATREFYLPGSTFKTFTMMSAFRAGKNDLMFPSYENGFRPGGKGRPIVDATQKFIPPDTVTGFCDAGCQEKDIELAYKKSSNQYFAQLAIALERPRLSETARLVGIVPVETADDAGRQGFSLDIWNTSNPRIAGALKPAKPTIVLGNKISLFDLGLEGMGQGQTQMTPFQMALIASIPANMEGKLMKPKIEADLPPQMFSQVLTPQQAAEIRKIMKTVTEESGGTGAVISRELEGTGIITGGKTGTAEKDAPKFKTNGERDFKIVSKKDEKTGEMIDTKEFLFYDRTDSWFICIAPLGTVESPEAPQLAIAVLVEGGGFGATTAAPIAARVIKKARELGLLGEKYKPKTQTTTKKKKGK